MKPQNKNQIFSFKRRTFLISLSEPANTHTTAHLLQHLRSTITLPLFASPTHPPSNSASSIATTPPFLRAAIPLPTPRDQPPPPTKQDPPPHHRSYRARPIPPPLPRSGDHALPRTARSRATQAWPPPHTRAPPSFQPRTATPQLLSSHSLRRFPRGRTLRIAWSRLAADRAVQTHDGPRGPDSGRTARSRPLLHAQQPRSTSRNSDL